MAWSSDNLVADIRKSSTDGEFKALAKQLQNEQSQIALLEPSVLDNVIECLDCREHSLGVMAALAGKLSRDVRDWPKVLLQMRAFVEGFTAEQVRVSPAPFCNLFHRFTELMCLRRQTMEGIPLLRTAIQRYHASPSCLTALHPDLVQLCLMAKCLKPALPFLDQEYTDLLTEHGQFDVKYVLLFYYYGGMVYTCLHDYLKALLFLTVCLTTPTVSISAIMVAAYKKFILVSLLKFGKEIVLPRYCSHIVERALKPLCGAYTQLARAYSTGKPGSILPVITKFQSAYTLDGNAGLVQRLKSRVYQHSIQRLTHTFMTVGLADVSSRLGLSGAREAEEHIRNMIEQGEVHATLDQVGGMVSFTENPEKYDSAAMVTHLDQQLQECTALEQKLSSLEKELAVDPRYMHRAMSSGVDDDPFFHDEAVI